MPRLVGAIRPWWLVKGESKRNHPNSGENEHLECPLKQIKTLEKHRYNRVSKNTSYSCTVWLLGHLWKKVFACRVKTANVGVAICHPGVKPSKVALIGKKNNIQWSCILIPLIHIFLVKLWLVGRIWSRGGSRNPKEEGWTELLFGSFHQGKAFSSWDGPQNHHPNGGLVDGGIIFWGNPFQMPRFRNDFSRRWF